MSRDVRAEHGTMSTRRLIVIGVIGVILGAGLLLVQRALNPDAIRTLAESQLGSLLGQRVQIGSMTVSLVPPVVTGEAIKIGNAATDPSQVQTKAISTHPQAIPERIATDPRP